MYPSWVQGMVATPAGHADRRSSSSASAGVFQPRVFRGRVLRARATASSSSRLVPREGRCPSESTGAGGPFVFSFVPRCQGLCGSQKYTASPEAIFMLGMSRHLGALVPGERPAELVGQARHRLDDRIADRFGTVAGERRTVLHPRLETAVTFHRREVQQHGEPRRALDERADRRLLQPDDEVALPVAGHRSVGGLGRSLADHDLWGDEVLALPLRPRPRHAEGSSRAQAGGQLPSAGHPVLARRAPGRSPRERYACVSSSGKSTLSRFAICSGAPGLRPAAILPAAVPAPDPADLRAIDALSARLWRCCQRDGHGRTHEACRSPPAWPILGRLARRSACHWAVSARYPDESVRVAALRRSSRTDRRRGNARAGERSRARRSPWP